MVLFNELGEENIHFGTPVVAVREREKREEEEGEEMMEVEIGGGEKIVCDLVIGAEGLNRFLFFYFFLFFLFFLFFYFFIFLFFLFF